MTLRNLCLRPAHHLTSPKDLLHPLQQDLNFVLATHSDPQTPFAPLLHPSKPNDDTQLLCQRLVNHLGPVVGLDPLLVQDLDQDEIRVVASQDLADGFDLARRKPTDQGIPIPQKTLSVGSEEGDSGGSESGECERGRGNRDVVRCFRVGHDLDQGRGSESESESTRRNNPSHQSAMRSLRIDLGRSGNTSPPEDSPNPSQPKPFTQCLTDTNIRKLLD